jgi:hypothetical protein
MKKIVFIFSIVCSISQLAMAQEPSPPPCYDFNDHSLYADPWSPSPPYDHFLSYGNWKCDNCEAYYNVTSGVPTGVTYPCSTFPVDPTQDMITILDNGGSSHFHNDVDYNALGINYLHYCLEYDYWMRHDGESAWTFGSSSCTDYGFVGAGTSTYLATPFHPRVYITWSEPYPGGTIDHTAYFECFSPITESSGMIHIAAPIEHSSSSTSGPSNSYGAWHLLSGTWVASDFNDILDKATSVWFDIDRNSDQNEAFAFDNICLTPCNVACNSNFDFEVEARTYTSFTPTNIVDIMLQNYNSTATYTYDWGDGTPPSTIASSGRSYIYSPSPFSSGVYNVCVTETQPSGNQCTNCMNFCMPTSSSLAGTCATCHTDFDFKLYADTYGASYVSGFGVPNDYVSIMLRSFNPSATYSYSWGDGTPNTVGHVPGAGHTYVPSIYSSGTYTVCVTEKIFDTLAQDTTSATTCMTFCIPTPNAPSMRKTQNTITSSSEIKLYPNPTDNNAIVDFTLTNVESVQLSVMDIYGKTVINLPAQKFNEGSQKINLNTSDLSSGIYQVNIKIGQNVTTKRLSIVK